MNTLAVVDIGSNAIRVHIANLLFDNDHYEFKTVEYLRIPLRLGEDVFTKGRISAEKEDKLVKLAQSLVNLFEIYGVKHYMTCATSAMREAQNQVQVTSSILKKTGFAIQIIDGNTEAEWTNYGLKRFIGDGTWIHIDVGGGSTEVNIYKDHVKIASHSFRIGAVRMLMKEDVFETKKEMIEWVEHYTHGLNDIQTIGTGGNIRKIHEMAKLSPAKPLKLAKIQEITEYIASYSIKDRINILKLNPDRADVILPSSEIYTTVMMAANSQNIYVPKVGLTDGMFEVLKNEVLATT